MTDVYISADIEADGPIPGQYSMLAFGLCVAATFDGLTFIAREPSETTFYRELKPAFVAVDERALAVSGLDRDTLVHVGADPERAMREAADWVTAEAYGARPVLVGYPVVFDWMFLHWYFVHFVGSSPFGFASALDMKSIYHAKASVTISEAGRDDLPSDLRGDQVHTHNALDDAVEQAGIFNRLFVWKGGQ